MKVGRLIAGVGVLASICFSGGAYAQNVSVTPGRISVEGAGADVNVQGGSAAGVNVNTAPSRTHGQTQVDVQGGRSAGVGVNTAPPASGAKRSASSSPRRTQNQTQIEVRGGNNVNVISSGGGHAETRVGQKVITSGSAARASGSSVQVIGGVQQETGELVNLDLSEQNFSGRDFSRRQIANVNFEAAILQNVSFSGSTLANVNFNDADLRGANFSGASLANVSVDNALLDHAIWPDGRICGNRSVGKCR